MYYFILLAKINIFKQTSITTKIDWNLIAASPIGRKRVNNSFRWLLHYWNQRFWIILIEHMEKQSKKTYSIFLPLIHHIQQLRQHYFLYDYIIFIVEASFLLSFPFRHSLLNSDHILTSIAVVSLWVSRNIWNWWYTTRLSSIHSIVSSFSSLSSSPPRSSAYSQRRSSSSPRPTASTPRKSRMSALAVSWP